MSYILEALRKADAERERRQGAVPGLNAQLLPPMQGGEAQEPAAFPLWRWAGSGLVLLLAAAAAWVFLSRDAQQPVAAAPPSPAAPAAAVAALAPAPGPVSASAPAAAPGQGSADLPPQEPRGTAGPPGGPTPAANKPMPPPARPAARPSTVTASGSAKPPAQAKQATAGTPSGRPKREASAADSAPKPADVPPARLPALAELPPEVRQLVPPLVVGGSVYSPQASVRMVVLNGQVFQEGNELGAELKLEQIRPKSAVLSIRGQRFELPL
jgi:general secretion pathway protein B